MVVAIASVLSGHPACHEIGMTGEITLCGRVLPVGGIKMKVLAAHRAGLSSVIIPKQDEGDLDELPEDIRNALTFVPVDLISEALRAALSANAQTQRGVGW
jgi:ATP-dependent Lon protease